MEPRFDLNKAIELVGARVYELDLTHFPDPYFIVTGCGGNGSVAQQAVANSIKNLPEKQRPICMFMLGDNGYDDGMSSPDDEGFNKFFYDVYPPHISCFGLLGNHDYKYHTKADLTKKLISIQQGREIAINQIKHSYLIDTENKIKLYQSQTLDPKKLPRWNMSFFYYSVIIGKKQIFCLDSNTYPKARLELESLIANGVSLEEAAIDNQAAWFKLNYQKAEANGYQKILMQHHGFYTCGKRIKKFDTHLYLQPEEIIDLNKLFKKFQKANKELQFELPTSSFNTIHAYLFEGENFVFDEIYVAHDHFMSVYNNKLTDKHYRICQYTAGGGGGDLQSRVSHLEHPYVIHLEQYGFFKVKQDYVELYTTEGICLRFNSYHHIPIWDETLSLEAIKLRNYIFDVCYKFLEQLKSEEIHHNLKQQLATNDHSYLAAQGLFGKARSMLLGTYSAVTFSVSFAKNFLQPNYLLKNEIKIANHLIAYFNQIKLPTPDEINLYIYNQLKILTDESSLLKLLQTEQSDFYIGFIDHCKTLERQKNMTFTWI